MGKATGFMEWSRRTPDKRPVADRLHDFKELPLPQEEAETKRQGGRCMDCGIPFCHQGCPLGNLIPDWNELVYRGRFRDAYVALADTNCFPEFTGRLCPAPCEAACTLAINQDPVTIEEIEKQIIERAFSEGWVQAQPPDERTGKRVAVVGSGPAGLAAASQLNRAGHWVTVFEADDRIGGMLRYGIPDFKMEKWVIDRRLDLMRAEGVEFVTGVCIGSDRSWRSLADDFDSTLLAIGARQARDLEVPGRDLAGVHFAMDYLEEQNRRVAGDSRPQNIDAQGKKVVILGGGDTGSDCFGTALRQGASEVVQIELFPEPPTERREGNPWPQWPMVFRTSTSQEEGGAREFAVMTKEVLGAPVADGSQTVRALQAVRVEVGDKELREVPGSEFEIPCDLLLLAMGFTGFDASGIADDLGTDVDARGNLVVDSTFATKVPGVFAAGDAMRGASLIVWAISDGREAARHINRSLRGKTSLPTRGQDAPFGGR